MAPACDFDVGLRSGLASTPPPAPNPCSPGPRSNLFEWAVTILGPPDTLYEGGFFNAVLKFPSDYPQSPPECRFTSAMWHPNGAELTAGARASHRREAARVQAGAVLAGSRGRAGPRARGRACSGSAPHAFQGPPPARRPGPGALARSLVSPLPLSPPPSAKRCAVFPDGRVCISILHAPGFDPLNPQESAAERWSPVHTVRLACPAGRGVGQPGRRCWPAILAGQG